MNLMHGFQLGGYDYCLAIRSILLIAMILIATVTHAQQVKKLELILLPPTYNTDRGDGYGFEMRGNVYPGNTPFACGLVQDANRVGRYLLRVRQNKADGLIATWVITLNDKRSIAWESYSKYELDESGNPLSFTYEAVILRSDQKVLMEADFMTAREQAEMHIFGQTVGKEIGDALIDGDVRRLTKTIQSAILAEREACAKICDENGEYYREEFFRFSKNQEAAAKLDAKAVCALVMADKIRARSNAPESLNLPNEIPKPGQVATVKDGRIVFIDPPKEWRHLGDSVFEIPETPNKAPGSSVNENSAIRWRRG